MLGALGSGAILFGSILALRQKRLKLLIAYSTIAQIGYLFLMFPLALGAATSNPWTRLRWTGGWLLAISHATAKAAMFMAAGLIAETLGHDRIAELGGIARALPMTVFAFAIGGLWLMGVPPSGGLLAKWLLLAGSIMEGQWRWAMVMLAGGLFAGGYVFIVLGKAFSGAERFVEDCAPVSRSREIVPLALALCAVLLGFVRHLQRRPICCRSAALRALDGHVRTPSRSSGMLIAATLILPLAMLAACVSQRLADRMPSLLVFAPLPAIAAALQEFQDQWHCSGSAQALLGLTFELDRPGAMLLGASALLWTAAGAYAHTYLRDRAGRRTFRGLVAGDAYRQPRRLHRRRRGELLLVLHAGQSRGLRTCHI